ncbi:MAG: glycine--tRNA ligase subunit beta [Pseudomonadota bacterium]
MADFVLELMSEEIPARLQAGAAAHMTRTLKIALTTRELAPQSLTVWVTPRRLLALAHGIPARRPGRIHLQRGPRVGAPEAAMQGFLRATGVSLDQCIQRETPKGETWFAQIPQPEQPATSLLPDAVAEIIDTFVWPLSMRWGEAAQRWVRPLRRITASVDGVGLPGGYGLGRIEPALAPGWSKEPGDHAMFLPFCDHVLGHRHRGMGKDNTVTLKTKKNAADAAEALAARLAQAGVVIDPDKRRDVLATRITEQLKAHDLTAQEDPGLMNEIVGLTEDPVPLLGQIDETFMSLPPALLVAVMRGHQRYLACRDQSGTLAPFFIAVADGSADPSLVHGYEKVLRARLADALFYWQQDLAVTDWPAKLGDVLFHDGLGSLADKTARLGTLSSFLADTLRVKITTAKTARQAARFALIDLASQTVSEHAHLHGEIGAAILAHQGQESAAVVAAVRAHPRPLGGNDAVPEDPAAAILSIAQNIDTLVGLWLVGGRATGSTDPHNLRRAALGLLRTVLEHRWSLALDDLTDQALAAYKAQDAQTKESPAKVRSQVLGFFADRLRIILRGRDVRHDIVAAVQGGTPPAKGPDPAHNPVVVVERAEALSTFLASEDGQNLLTAYRRACGILPSRGLPGDPTDQPDGATQADRTLAQALANCEQALQTHTQDYPAALAALAAMRAPVDDFFESVMVMDPNPALRAARLLRLDRLCAQMEHLADFSAIAQT